MRDLWLACLIISLLIIVPYGLSAVLSLLPWKFNIERVTQPFGERSKKAGKVLIGIAAVLATVGAIAFVNISSKQPSKTKHQSLHGNVGSIADVMPTIKFTNPRGTTQNPLMVLCQQDIEVAGRIPKGYAFAVGNAAAGPYNSIAFVPQIAALPAGKDTWKVPLVFGSSSDAGKKFNLYLEVLPSRELNYLVAEAQSLRQYVSGSKYNGQTWWTSPGLPPKPAIAQDQETAKRTAATTGCPK
jgi:hypothetical protein